MNYYIVYKEEYPWDVRVEKIAKTLLRPGDRVTIVARNNNSEPVLDVDGNVEIVRLPKFEYVPYFLIKILNIALFFNPFWFITIFRSVEPGSILIVRDLPLVFLGYFVSKFRKSKLIFDMAECYPEMYSSMLEYSDINFFKKLVIKSRVIDIYEKMSCKLASHIFVMIEESRDRLISKGIDPSKISIVSNTPPVANKCLGGKLHSGTSLNLVYVGFLTKIRGLDLVLRAIRKYIDSNSDFIRLDIIGRGGEKDYLSRLVDELSLNGYVYIHGWLDHEAVQEIYNRANVGVLTYRVCGHWNNTIPNKIFDYMSEGIPVLATEVLPIKRIIEKTESGLICKDGNVDDIVSALVSLKKSRL